MSVSPINSFDADKPIFFVGFRIFEAVTCFTLKGSRQNAPYSEFALYGRWTLVQLCSTSLFSHKQIIFRRFKRQFFSLFNSKINHWSSCLRHGRALPFLTNTLSMPIFTSASLANPRQPLKHFRNFDLKTDFLLL